MIETKLFNTVNKPEEDEKIRIVDFLHEHLEEYRDSKPDIEKAISFALEEVPSFGGFILLSFNDSVMTGVVVINQTGMSGYIPENILVYIATHKNYRGQGVGQLLIKRSIEMAKGDIALHVEPENPARFLYKKMGFSSKYKEMRYKKMAN